jgi:hypothetical protein
MNLLRKASPEMAYLKLGIYGEAGSGKTFTSSRVAIGLAAFIKSKKPVGFADTETGSDFVAPAFKAVGLGLIVAKTRAFADLLGIIDEAAGVCDILIIDSVTHFWNELIDAYLKKNEKKRLTLRDWQPLKQTWREFTDRFVNSKLHIILCGRSADKWEEVEEERPPTFPEMLKIAFEAKLAAPKGIADDTEWLKLRTKILVVLSKHPAAKRELIEMLTKECA